MLRKGDAKSWSIRIIDEISMVNRNKQTYGKSMVNRNEQKYGKNIVK